MQKLNSLITSPVFIKHVANIIKDASGERQWRLMVNHAESYVPKAVRGLQILFNKQETEILNRLENRKSFTDEIDWQEWEVKFQEFNQLLLPEIFATWGSEILNQIIIGIDFNADTQLIHEFIQEHSYKMAANVNETTKKKIQSIFDTAVDNGESVPQIMKRIRTEFDNIGKVRANMIARSEIIRAHNASADMAYLQSGVVEFKQWHSSKGERRTCAFCNALHGRIIAVGGDYFKQGDRFEVVDANGKRQTLKLDYSDIKYPPVHVKCRCCLLPVISDYTRPRPEPKPVEVVPEKPISASEIRNNIISINDKSKEKQSRLLDESESYVEKAKQAFRDKDKVNSEKYANLSKEKIIEYDKLRETIKKDIYTELQYNKQSFDIPFVDHSDGKVLTNTTKESLNKLSRMIDKSLISEERALHVDEIMSGRESTIGTSVQIKQSSSISTIIHETGHYIENSNIKIAEKTKAFLEIRTKGDKAESLRELTKDNGFNANEITKKDKFIEPYMGAIYPKGTEILSMGIQMLIDNPVKLATKDPEYFDFIISILRGL